MSHTVDEVSELLDVPRPTLYRYLKEYSIPHIRRSGKIYVPEESFDRIQEVRELHKEGLGTESVRKRLQEERSNLDVEGLAERMDRISESLENLQRNLKPANGESSAQSLQTILVKQNLLISAVFDLTEILEDLLATNGQRRKVAFGDLEEEIGKQKTSFEELEWRPEKTENDATTNRPVIETLPGPMRPSIAPDRRRKFGALARRRRLGALVILLTLLTSTTLTAAVALSGEESSEASQNEPSASSQEATPTRSEEVDAGNQNAALSDPPAHAKEEFARYNNEEGYEGFASEPSPYQAQDATSKPFPQAEPFPQEYPWLTPTPVDSPPP